MICTTGVPFKKGKIMAVDGETNGSDLIQFEKSLSDADRRRLQEYRAEYETWKFIGEWG